MNKPLFSVRIDDQNPRHTRLTVFNKGANAGTLVIDTCDLDEFRRRLEGETGEWVRTPSRVEYEVGDEPFVDNNDAECDGA